MSPVRRYAKVLLVLLVSTVMMFSSVDAQAHYNSPQYSYGYGVQDGYGANFGHNENRDGGITKVSGEYDWIRRDRIIFDF